MEFLSSLLTNTLLQVGTSLLHNWPFLALSVVISVALKLFVDTNKVSALLTRYRRVGVLGATVAAVATPFCSCGTTAVVLGMMASTIPWAPIIAFMVASPLTSPEELVYSAGLFGWPFALAFFISSIVLGLLGGLAGEILERRGWLKNQARFATVQPTPARAAETQAEPKAAVPAAAPLASAARIQPLPLRANRAALTGASSTIATSLTGAASLTGAGALSLSLCCAEAAPAAEFEPVRASNAGSCGCGSAPATTPTPNAAQSATCGCGSTPATAPTQAAAQSAACGCDSTPATTSTASTCGCGSSPAQAAAETPAQPARVTWRAFLSECYTTGKRLLVMFLGFAFIGYLLNGLIPSAWVTALFGKGSVYSVPLAATLGLPFYLNTEGSLPLVRALIDGGMSQGAALAFLITGAGTSIGAVAGALTIARWRVIAVVIGTLWAGAVLLGYLYNLLLLSGLI